MATTEPGLSPWRDPLLRAALTVVLLSSTALWSVVPFLPLKLLHEHLGTAVTGTVVAASAIGYMLGQYPAALLADRFAASRLAALSLLLEGLATAAVLVTANPLLLIALRLAAGVARAGVRQCVRVTVVRAVPDERRGQCFAYIGSMGMAGTTAGAIAGGVLATFRLDDVFAAAALACLATIPLCLRLRTPAPLAASSPTADARTRGLSLARRYIEALVPVSRLSPGKRGLLLAILLETTAGALLIGVYDSVWGVFLRYHGAPEWVLGASYALFTLPYLVLAPLAGRLGDRGHRKALALAGTVISALLMLAYTRLRSLPVILSGELIEAVSGSLAEPALSAATAEIGTGSVQQKAFGLTGTVQAASMSGGAVLGGWMLRWGVNAPLLAGAAVALGLAAMAALAWPRGREHEHHRALARAGQGAVAALPEESR